MTTTMEEKTMTKLNELTLLDEWCATGTNYEDFKQYLGELSACTEFVKVSPADTSVLSKASVDDKKLRFWELKPSLTGAPQSSYAVKNLAVDKVLERGNHQRLIDATMSDVGALFYCDGRVFFPSTRVFTKSMVQFGAGGDAMGIPSFERDLWVASLFRTTKTNTFVVREIAGVKKLVSILSARYNAFPQSALCEIIEAVDTHEFGEMKVHLWTIDNWVSNIWVEFPEKAEEISDYYELKDKFVPGLWLQTSDTGDASVKIYPTWRHGRSVSYVEKAMVKKAHSGKVELSELVELVNKKAFAEYTKLPEAMCNLMTQDLTDAAWDLENPKDVEKNRRLMESVIKKAFKSLGITAKAIGKANRQALQEQMLMEFAGNIAYTAYDVAAAFMSLPERLEGVHATTLHNLEAAVSEAPYIKYGVGRDDEEAEEELILI